MEPFIKSSLRNQKRNSTERRWDVQDVDILTKWLFLSCYIRVWYFVRSLSVASFNFSVFWSKQSKKRWSWKNQVWNCNSGVDRKLQRWLSELRRPCMVEVSQEGQNIGRVERLEKKRWVKWRTYISTNLDWTIQTDPPVSRTSDSPSLAFLMMYNSTKRSRNERVAFRRE